MAVIYLPSRVNRRNKAKFSSFPIGYGLEDENITKQISDLQGTTVS